MELIKNLLQRSQFTEMILPCCEISQLDNPDVGRNHILYFFLVPARKIISEQEIYSDSLFDVYLLGTSYRLGKL